MSKKIELRFINVDYLDTVDFNPNELTEQQKAHLKKTIGERGMMQPLTVTPSGAEDRYIVIDGYHRLNACINLSMATVPCLIVPDKSMTDIKIDLINLNQIKGEFNDKKYANLIKNLTAEITNEQVKSLLDMADNDFNAYLALANKEINDLKDFNKAPPKEVSFIVKDIRCPHCGHTGPKADFKVRDTE